MKSRGRVTPSTAVPVVQVLISPRVFARFPATALRDVRHTGTVADVLDALLTHAVRRGIRVYTRQQAARRKAHK